MSIISSMIKKISTLFIFFFCVNLAFAHHTPKLRSQIAAVYDQNKKEYIYLKNHNLVAPIASITKLMTAIVTLESGLPLLETLKITRGDIDRYKNNLCETGGSIVTIEGRRTMMGGFVQM